MSSKTPIKLLLYSTSACHLCEQAELLLLKCPAARGYSIDKIDIALDDALLARYGTSIPVLARAAQNQEQSELFWPFDENKITRFLSDQ